MTRQLTIGIMACALVTTACGKSAEQEQAEQAAQAVAEAAQTGADSMAEGVSAIAKGLEQLGKSTANVEVLEFEALGAAFPEVSDWTREAITGSTSTFPMKMSEAKTSYRNGDKQVRLEAVDAALAQMLMAPMSMFLAANYSERSSDGYKKGTTVKGQPAFEDVNNTNESAEVTVVVDKRFIVTARGSRGTGIDNVRAVLEQMDFSKLTAAGKQ